MIPSYRHRNRATGRTACGDGSLVHHGLEVECGVITVISMIGTTTELNFLNSFLNLLDLSLHLLQSLKVSILLLR